MTDSPSRQGRIVVPADLDAVTDIGDEDHSEISPAAVERIWQAARHWYQAGMHPAIQVCLRHNGAVVLNRAIGHGWGNGPADPPDAEKVPVTTETPFCVYSAAKAITTTVVHMLVERGAFSLDDRVCDYLPDYTSHGKDRTTIRHVMTHSAGVPFATGPRPDLKRMNDSEYAREQARRAASPSTDPGLMHIYHGLTWGPLIREIVSAATGRRHPRHPGRRDPRPARASAGRITVWPTGCAAGRAQPRHRQAAARADRGRASAPPSAAPMQQIIPFSNTPLFLTERDPVVEHRLDRRRAVPVRRDPAPRWRTRRRAGHAAGDAARPRSPRRRRLRPDVATGLMPMRWGTGYMLGSKRFGPFGRNAPGRLRPHRADQHRDLGRPASAGCRSG